MYPLFLSDDPYVIRLERHHKWSLRQVNRPYIERDLPRCVSTRDTCGMQIQHHWANKAYANEYLKNATTADWSI